MLHRQTSYGCAQASTLADRQADLVRGFQVDDQLELGLLFDREIRGRRAFENLLDIGGRPPT
jgi:hypothetical protein